MDGPGSCGAAAGAAGVLAARPEARAVAVLAGTALAFAAEVLAAAALDAGASVPAGAVLSAFFADLVLLAVVLPAAVVVLPAAVVVLPAAAVVLPGGGGLAGGGGGLAGGGGGLAGGGGGLAGGGGGLAGGGGGLAGGGGGLLRRLLLPRLLRDLSDGFLRSGPDAAAQAPQGFAFGIPCRVLRDLVVGHRSISPSSLRCYHVGSARLAGGSGRRAIDGGRFEYHRARHMDAPAPPVTTFALFRGKPALAAFRRERLVGRASACEPTVADLDGCWIYFVRTSDASGWIVRRLERLLDASAVMGEPAMAELAAAIVVTPRPGTISAWSSKATDIAHHCGLRCVARIERGIAWTVAQARGDPGETSRVLAQSGLLHDRMTQCAYLPQTFPGGNSESVAGAEVLFLDATPPSHSTIRLGADARAALEGASASLGLALSPGEIDYLEARFLELGRDPTDAELMMFAQVNSEHCRHKIFNASWTIDGVGRERSLFDMIRHTQACNPGEVLSAYSDNAAVVRGHAASWFVPHPDTARYSTVPGRVELVMKVETHNHPTAISPFAGAATGSGGEIRDEAATGRGARSKAGVTGFSVSNLRIPGFVQPWEHDRGRPSHIASALEIMLDGPIGAAAFNNEFGRPALGGYFRTLEIDVARAATSGGSGAGDPAARSAGAAREDFAGQETDVGAGRRPRVYGYHKPIMIAGGAGNIRADQVRKSTIAPGARLVVLGGPAMLIGLGGGAASSSGSRSGEESLDFASVQRENPEMQRRCQEVIDRCWQLGAHNPILSIHDVGPEACPTPCPSWSTAPDGAHGSSCAPSRATTPRCRRSRSGATSPRNATSSPSTPGESTSSRRCASASAARGRKSGKRSGTASSRCTIPGSMPLRSRCR